MDQDDVVGDIADIVEGEAGEVEELTFGDAPENETITAIRNHAKEKEREAAILKRRVAELEEKTNAPVDVGPKPTREEFDYVDEVFDAAVDAWYEKKTRADQHNAVIAKPDEELQKRFEEKLSDFRAAIPTLAFDDAQNKVEDTLRALSVAQQSAIIKAADDPARLTYALSQNPDKLAKLASENDLVQFIKDVVKLETNMTTRKRAAVDEPVKGNAGAATNESVMEKKLEAEAEKTGDRTKLINWRREQRAA